MDLKFDIWMLEILLFKLRNLYLNSNFLYSNLRISYSNIFWGDLNINFQIRINIFRNKISNLKSKQTFLEFKYFEIQISLLRLKYQFLDTKCFKKNSNMTFQIQIIIFRFEISILRFQKNKYRSEISIFMMK